MLAWKTINDGSRIFEANYWLEFRQGDLFVELLWVDRMGKTKLGLVPEPGEASSLVESLAIQAAASCDFDCVVS